PASVLGEILERGQLAEAVLRCGENEAVLRDDQCIDPLLVAQLHAAYAGRLSAHRPHFFLDEPYRLAARREQQNVLGTVGDGNAHQLIARIERHGNDAAGARPREQRERGLFYRSETRRHEDELALFEIFDREHGADALALLERQQIHDGLAARSTAGLRQLIDLEPVKLAPVGKTQRLVWRMCA